MKKVTKQFIFFLIMVLPMMGFSQKRVVLRDSATTGSLSRFLNNAEGWVRQNPQANDAIFLTGNFSNILRDTLRRKDSLIIIAHGSNFPPRGTTFTWFGNKYYNFGVGGAGDTMPIPANLNTRDFVRALMYTCFSGRAPDTAGNNTSLVNRLVAKLGANSSGTGFSDYCIAGSTITGNSIVFKDKKLTAKARGVLIDSSYAALRRDVSYIVAPPCN
ncbi:MAG: hypothetical protein ACHQVK_05150, partial [Candidatus Paceibacterales bacterium]